MNTQTLADGAGLRLDDRYRLITQIGSGGMSVVWYALDEVLARYVAVKVLTASLAAEPLFPRRLLSEARAAAGLSHPHITAVHDFGVHRAPDDGQWTPYLVMELLDGELLSDALQRGPLPWRQAVTVCAQLATALQAAHEHGIVHRDVTPANVMLTGTGVKVLDFGIAALIGDLHGGGSGDVFGTAAYLAPERLVSGQITAAADVYAAGLVLYQCLAGHLPWPAESITEMLTRMPICNRIRCRCWIYPAPSNRSACSACPASRTTGPPPPNWPKPCPVRRIVSTPPPSGLVRTLPGL